MSGSRSVGVEVADDEEDGGVDVDVIPWRVSALIGRCILMGEWLTFLMSFLRGLALESFSSSIIGL